MGSMTKQNHLKMGQIMSVKTCLPLAAEDAREARLLGLLCHLGVGSGGGACVCARACPRLCLLVRFERGTRPEKCGFARV